MSGAVSLKTKKERKGEMMEGSGVGGSDVSRSMNSAPDFGPKSKSRIQGTRALFWRRTGFRNFG